MKPANRLGLAAIVLLAATGAASAAATRTVQDLKIAYRGETEARAKYDAYAERALKEGRTPTALLFRALAVSETIHARNHWLALSQLGVKSPAEGRFGSPVAATLANLEESAKDETAERDRSYPEMIRDAVLEKQTGAIQTFRYAQHSEAQHAALLREALHSRGQTAVGPTYSICPICGATYAGDSPVICPTCLTSRTQFIVIRQAHRSAVPVVGTLAGQ